MTNIYRLNKAFLRTKSRNLDKNTHFVRLSRTKIHKLYRFVVVQRNCLRFKRLQWTKMVNGQNFVFLSELYRCCIGSFSSSDSQNKINQSVKCPNHSWTKRQKKSIYLYEIYNNVRCPVVQPSCGVARTGPHTPLSVSQSSHRHRAYATARQDRSVSVCPSASYGVFGDCQKGAGNEN